MTLEFEKLTDKIDEMARSAAARQERHSDLIETLLATLNKYAADWPTIDKALATAKAKSDPKHYRSARPLPTTNPLNAHITPDAPPAQATLLATDGSQIMPDRHAAHLYYLINIGGIVYHHGDNSRSPLQFTKPDLKYPQLNQNDSSFASSSGEVSVERDLQEIGTLADLAWEYRQATPPVLAMLDQRLLYWPIGGSDAEPNEDVKNWLKSMTKISDSHVWLAGYIDRPMTNAVVTLLRSIAGLENPAFDWKSLGKREAPGGQISDGMLFSYLLQPGERSKVFVNESPPNTQFRQYHESHEVCFFYLNPGLAGRRVARIDIPMWVAQDETAITAVHALIMYQCRILGDYPYILARADEMAVVGHRDHEALNMMIDRYMEKHDVSGSLTGKQGSKNLARGGKTRHEGL